MVAKDEYGNNTRVPGLILSNNVDIRRFFYCLKLISTRKDKKEHEVVFDYKSEAALESLKNYNIKIDIC